MKKLLFVLSVLFTVIGVNGQSIMSTSNNPDPNKYTYNTLNEALTTVAKEGGKFTVLEKGGYDTTIHFSVTYFVRKKSEGWNVNGGTIVSMQDTNYVAVVDVSQSEAIHFNWFGIVNDSVTDATPVLKTVRTFINNSKYALAIFLPNGKYRLTDSCVIRKGIKLIGENPLTTIIVRDFLSGGHGSLGAITFMSNSPGEKITGIDIENIGFEGNANLLGHDQWGHELSFMGTDGATVRNCIFNNFRGDGLYVGAGLSSDPADWRFNSNLLVDKCRFNGGPLYRNRNGISLIDCDGYNITNSDFIHIGNDTLSRSVGCIDNERNRNSAYARQGLIWNCRFINCMALNTSAVTAFTTTTPGTFDNVGLLTVDHCFFDSTYWGVSINNYLEYPSLTGDKTQISITNTQFLYNHIAVRAAGNFIDINHNYFKGNATQYCNVQLGLVLGARDLEAINVNFTYNILDSCGQNGGVEISNMRYGDFEHNQFTDRRSAFYFYSDAGSNPDRKGDHWKFLYNTVGAPALANGSGSLYMFNAAAGFNLKNFLINGTCEEYGNILDNRVARATGEELYFNNSVITKQPTKGTWNVGNILKSITGSTGNYILRCVQGGTYGVDTLPGGTDTVQHAFLAKYYSSTLQVTNGENLFKSHLREGQYIKLSHSSLSYRIASIPDTSTIYLDQIYNYYNGTDSTQIVNAQWVKPVWSNEPINYNWTVLDVATHIKPGNVSQFIEYYATKQDTVYIDNDTTTTLDTKIHIRNVTPFNYSLVIIPDSAMKFNYSGLPIVLKKGDEIDLIYKGNNTYRIWDFNQTEKFNFLPNNDTAIIYKNGNVYISPSSTVLPPPSALLNINTNQRLYSTPALMLANANSGFGTGVQQNWRVGYDSNIITGQFEHITDTLGFRDTRLKVSNTVDSLFTLMTLSGNGNVSIGKHILYPNASALLDLRSTISGFLMPRMTTTQANNITNKANSLEIYNTTINRPAWYDSINSVWRYFADTNTLSTAYMPLIPTSATIQANTAGGITNLLTLRTVGNQASNRGNSLSFEIPNNVTSTRTATIGSILDASSHGTLFFSVGDSTTNLVEKARLNSLGQLLIGTTTAASASTLFQVEGTSFGSLPAPRVTSTQNNAIGNLTGGLLAYNREKQTYRYYDTTNSKWVAIPKSDTTTLTDGMLMIGVSSTGQFKRATLTPGTGISVTNSAGGITIGTSGLAVAPTFATVASNVVNTTSTAADITGLGWTVVAGKKYQFHIALLTTLDNTGGIGFRFTLPTSTTILAIFSGNSTSSTATMQNFINASGGNVTGYTRFTGATGTVNIDGYFTVTTSGTIQLQFNPVTATQTATILAGSSGTMWEVQ